MNSPRDEAAPALPPIRILLIDDDEEDYLLTRDLLAEIPDANIRLDWTADARLALDDMCDRTYDLFLVDYQLGPLTGLELIREARDRGCHGPVILLTGVAERRLDYAAMQAGAADYLEKGKLDAALLERAIRYTLQQQWHAEDLERKVRQRTVELEAANAALQAEVTERARAEEALREADRRKDQFLATLAHELRNPLAPIRNALEIMRLSGNRPEAVENGRAMIERQVRQLVRLVDDLLDLSRINRGAIQLRKERVPVEAILESALESCRPLIDRAGHALVVDLPDEPIVLDADPTRLAQVVLNLLNNATRYSAPGGRIDVTARRDGDRAVFRVRDRGIGIAPEHLPRVFDMFAQVHGPDHAQEGLGIGLSLVRNLVEMHGGSVVAESDGPGLGATFTVRLPVAAEPEA